jgi:hypothetical protein
VFVAVLVRLDLTGRASAIMKSVPEPVKAIVLGESSVLLVMLTEPVSDPTELAANDTLIVQLLFAASAAPQVFVCEKSPVVAILLMETVAAVLL